jgi:periplasmic protein TonB
MPAAAPTLRQRLSQLSTLQIALLVSLAVHGALMMIRFVDPESFNRVFKDTYLEVVLVNAGSARAPDKAQVIAQRNLEGGGEAQNARATSPLPPSMTAEVGEAIEDARRQIDQLQEQQVQLLAQVRAELAKLPPPDPQRDEGNPEERAQEEHRRQLLQLLAQIEKRIQDENSRPKKRYVSPSAREGSHALYYDTLRRKIEDNGTRNFPETAGRKLYGELTMLVAVDALGRVVETEVVQSSGNRTLDKRAVAIVHSAAPYGAFTSAMRREFDQLVFASRFRFDRSGALATSVSNAPQSR